MSSMLPFLRSTVAAALCGSFLLGPLAAVAAAPRSQPASLPAVDRAALVLDRFSFGPRPGELAKVRAMGVDAWLERQLAPERIADSALEQKLSIYPALQLTQEERLERYPTPGMIRQFAKNGALPQNPEEAAIVAAQVEFYEMRQQAKSAAEAMTAASGAAAAVPATSKAAAANNIAITNPDVTVKEVPAPPNLEKSTPPMPQPQVDAILALPPAQRYQRLLHMEPAQLIGLRKGLHGDEARVGAGLTPVQKETLSALAGTNRMISGEVFAARLLRDVYSDRELEAVMTDFWLNHFNVYIKKDQFMPSLLPQYEQTVRAHALGRFEDLLSATAKSPAMLLYLDNAQSTGPNSLVAVRNLRSPNAKKNNNVGLNENYARELMELHTLGVSGGYTQRDVTEVAKVFTGWTTDKPGEGGQFVYNDRRHEPGPKQVLGHTIRQNGESEGEEVLHLLANSPATAHFISLELAERFVSDTPPPALVDRMAQSFLGSHGETKAVLQTMVHSPEFFSPATVHAKLKTPLEYVVSAARITGADIQNPLPMAQAIERLGMPLYGCQPPTGYKWDAATWLSSSALVNRMNFSLLLGSGKLPGTVIDLARLEPQGQAASSEEKERTLELAVLESPASGQTRTAVLSQSNDETVQQAVQAFKPAGEGRPVRNGQRMMQVNDQAPGATQARTVAPADKQSAIMLGLLLGSPEFQRR